MKVRALNDKYWGVKAGDIMEIDGESEIRLTTISRPHALLGGMTFKVTAKEFFEDFELVSVSEEK